MKKILIVDDDVHLSEAIANYLSLKTGHKIIMAEDGEVAWDLIQMENPDMILLDVVLPQISGIALYKMLQKYENTKKIPVIFMSGVFLDDVFKKESIEMGVVDYILKPLSFKALLEKVNSVLS
ncbi:hypothetical protein DRQ09_05005 [candidate division KSB1 bacterium]|nr:MAG: hypothetical protein DRQ09_05005 [candidate division KSB1 bacterium]